MKMLYADIIPTQYVNAHKIEIGFHTFDLQKGMIFQYRLLNQYDFPIDGNQIVLGGPDFQNWPAAPEGSEESFDENYIIDKILTRLQLEKNTLASL